MKAIFILYPETVKTKYRSDTEMYAWDKDGNIIELDLTAVNNWVDPEAYKFARQKAYAPLPEQLDMQYWDRVNGTDTWKQHIDAVKTAHPKPLENA